MLQKQCSSIVRPSTARSTDPGSRTKIMKTKFASSVLTALLYTQGLLGFAGLTSVVLRDFAHREPTFVQGLTSVDADLNR